ncbi:MAG: DUF4340 domain-containing protein [Gammaproteobacteria bacterium]|nr:DUF4340 domain-containing protein [Gammaproteobacteria bacterium]
MSAQRVGWLLAAGVVIIAFAIWVSSQRHLERATASGDLVLPGLERGVNGVSAVKLQKGTDVHTTLKRTDGGWQVEERGWPADLARVRRLLLDLGSLNVVEEKTRLPANYPQLGVEDPGPKASGTRVDVTSPARSWSLIVGKPSGAKSGFVRVVGRPQSVLAAPLLAVDAEPKQWLDKSLLDLPAERLREIEERPAQGAAFKATRAKKEDPHFTLAPVPKGRELTGPGAADALSAALSGLNLEDVSHAAAAPQAAQAVFRTYDGLEVEAHGRKDGNRPLVTLAARATAPGAQQEAQSLNARWNGWEFEIPDYKYAAIFSPLDELLKPLPEPKKPAKAKTPAPGTAPAPAAAQ